MNQNRNFPAPFGPCALPQSGAWGELVHSEYLNFLEYRKLKIIHLQRSFIFGVPGKCWGGIALELFTLHRFLNL